MRFEGQELVRGGVGVAAGLTGGVDKELEFRFRVGNCVGTRRGGKCRVHSCCL